MRKDWIVNEGSADQARFRFTATRVRREVIVDVPVGADLELVGGYHHHRLRFTLAEAEAFLALFLQAVTSARE